MTSRAGLAAIALVVPLAAGCVASGSSGGTGPQPLGAGTTQTRPAQLPKTTDTVAALVRHGANSLASVHFTLTSRLAAGRRLTGSGTETVHAGAVTGLSATLRGAGLPRTRLVVADGTTYFRVPSGRWQRLLASGGKAPAPAVRRAAASVAPLVSPAAIVATVASGRVQLLGSGVLASVPFARYAATTPVAALTVSPARTAWTNDGVSQVRLDLRVERHGRPMVAVWRLLGAAPAAVSVHFSRYNRPARITAPR